MSFTCQLKKPNSAGFKNLRNTNMLIPMANFVRRLLFKTKRVQTFSTHFNSYIFFSGWVNKVFENKIVGPILYSFSRKSQLPTVLYLAGYCQFLLSSTLHIFFKLKYLSSYRRERTVLQNFKQQNFIKVTQATLNVCNTEAKLKRERIFFGSLQFLKTQWSRENFSTVIFPPCFPP